MSNFDDILSMDDNDQDRNAATIAPLFTVKNDEEKSKWIKNAFNVLMKRYKGFFEEAKENLRLYKGNVYDIPKSSANSRSLSEMDPHLEKARNTKLYVNKIYDCVEFRVTTHNAAKPGIDIGPANVEYEDRIGAKLAKAVVDSVWYTEDEDEVERTAIRHACIVGEHWVATLWDKEKGDLAPAYKNLKKTIKEGKEMEIDVDISGGAPSGQMKYNVKEPVKNGDVAYKHYAAWQVLTEPVDSISKLEWIMTWDIEYVDVLKKKYPSKKDKIETLLDTAEYEGFDSEFLRKIKTEGKTIILTVWHKRCRYLPDGARIIATIDGKILKDDPMPYEQDELPFTRLTDLDLPGELRGRSFIRNIKGLQHQHYFLTSMMAANMRLMGYPKWVIESGSVQIKDLANTRNVVMVRPGAEKPFILQPSPTPPEVFKQIQDLEIAIDAQVKGAFANPNALPKRADSAAAFEYLDSKDSLRAHTMFSKVNKFRVELAKQTIWRAAQFYKVDDKRLVKIVGKNHEHDLKHFNFANFKRPYDIRVKEGSALPEEKSARLKTIVELVERLPEGTFSTQQILDMLDLTSVEKLFDIGTKSLRAAESIIQDLLQGNPVPPPEGFEDLMTYWQTFGTYIQDRQFKESVPADMKQNVLDYLTAIEALMFDKAQKNPAFAEKLTTLELYPLVFSLPPAMPEQPEASMIPPEMMAQEEAAAPETVTGLAPEDEEAVLQYEQVNAASDLMNQTAQGKTPEA